MLTLRTDPLRVVIVADDPFARAGLAALLADAGVTVLATNYAAYTGSGESFETSEADLMLWDLGREAGAAVAALTDGWGTGLPVVALASDDSLVTAALAAGVRGYLSRTIDAPRLSVALAAAASGLLVLDPQIVGNPLPHRDTTQLIEDLTPRETEVLQLLAEGMANKAIAARLSISEHTAKFHVNAILSKLGASSRTEAVARAARLGLIHF